MPNPRLSSRTQRSLLAGLVLILSSGCTADAFKKFADKETFTLLGEKSSKVPNSGTDLLDITPPEPIDLDKLEKNFSSEAFLGDRAHIEKGARKIDLTDALGFAVTHNRAYRGEKELVYLSALDLTLTRQQFTPILTGLGTATLNNRPVETNINTFINESTLTTNGSLSLSSLQRTGTRLAIDLTSDFVKFLTGDLRAIGDSSLAVTVAQPLLKGAGYLAASEVLTQGERGVLYDIRTFTQFRKSFAVDIASQYYRALQSRESARNTYLAYQAFVASVEREKMLAETGVRPTKSFYFQVRQAQLSAETRWLTAIRTYEQELDDLKIQLGLPVREPLLLKSTDLTGLEIIDPPGNLEESITTALVTRLDLWNARDQVEDAARQVKIATQNILPRVDALIGYKVSGDAAETDRFKIDSRRGNVTAAVDVDLNLNQKPNRNDLRAAQIAEQRARRELELAEESVRSGIRTAWRELELSRTQDGIALEGLKVSEERVRLETELLEEGQGTARDLVEAQRNLIDARNAVIATRVNHTLARLQLWRDMGILFIRKDGSWANVLEKEPPKGS